MTKGSIDIKSEGIVSKTPIRVYNINDDTLTHDELISIVELLADPIVDEYKVNQPVLGSIPISGHGTMDSIITSSVIEMSPKPGVNDPEGEVVREAIKRKIGREIGGVSYAKQYLYKGELSSEQYINLQKQLGPLIGNEFRKIDSKEWKADVGIGFHFPEIKLPEVQAFNYINIDIDDSELIKLSDDRLLALNLEEMKVIQNLFKDPNYIKKRAEVGLKDAPTDAELESLAQTWSEHCIHKKFKAKWIYTSDDPNDKSGLPNITDDMFKSIIVKTTEEISKNIDWLVSVFEDNAGIIKLNNRWNIASKFETHNHPSAIEGFGGSGTGGGGDQRDAKSCGKGMIVIVGSYGFRFPHPDFYKDLPSDIVAPIVNIPRIVQGIEDYGNKMGIPTIYGNVMVHENWLKPAVYVGNASVQKAKINGVPTHVKDIRTNYIALSLGGRVGKDGIHGATGSSQELESDAEQSEQINQSVQIGNPIVQKGVFEVMNILTEQSLVEATQDCGAGGWNSAVGELTGLLNNLEKKRYEIKKEFEKENITQKSSYTKRRYVAQKIIDFDKKASPFNDELIREVESEEIFNINTNGKGGVVMDLTHAPEKYKGLIGWEKLISEAQEREVIVIKPENLKRVLELCKLYNVEATNIAEFNNSGYYHVKDQDTTITYLPIEFINSALPQWEIKAHWTPCKNKEPELPNLENLTDKLLEFIGRPNVQSYEWITTTYDHEVQGKSLIKPIIGVGRGKSDAVAYRPVLDEKEVVIETWGSNPWHGDIDAYEMGKNNVVDAIGKMIALGGNLDKIVFNGNTTCPKPEKDPYIAAQVIRMVKGSQDAQKVFGTPTDSGKDSTSMERSYTSTKTGEEVHVKAKPELLMSGMGIIADDSTLTTADFKLPGDVIYIIGETRDELGGSEYYSMHNETGKNVPVSKLDELRQRYNDMPKTIAKGIVHSAKYIENFGLAAALTESAIAGDLGIDVSIDSIDNGLNRADKILFSGTTGRFIVTVHESQKKTFEESMKEHYVKEIGTVRSDKEFNITYKNKLTVKTDINTLREKHKGDIIY